MTQDWYCTDCIFKTEDENGAYCEVGDLELINRGEGYLRPHECIRDDVKVTEE